MFIKRSGSVCFLFIFLSLFLLPTGFPLEAAGTPEKIPVVVVTGSRLAENLEDVPAPAYVVTRQEIEKSGARNVQDVLNRLPGVVGLVNGASMT
ncbi:MAG: TonB-dependent receptor plug domain-containing protein, partial [Synergistaceae bacterium]|nr:TonB-dependent receptor plug domain-containing protein [Synergistaceae bacterium]